MTDGKPIKLPHASPYRDHLGLEYMSVEGGRSVSRLTIQEKHFNARSVLHGGAAFTMFDSGMGNALRSVLNEGEGSVTVEMDVSYLSAASSGTLVCESKVLHRGKNLAFLESEIRLEDKLIAKASGTFSITKKRSKRAKNRPD